MSEGENLQGKIAREQRFQKVLANFSSRLSQIIDDKTIAQKDLANYLGYASGQITHWKKGKIIPKADDLVGISEYIEIPIEYLLGLDRPDEAKPASAPVSQFNHLWSEEQAKHIEMSASVIWDATPDFQWVYHDDGWRELFFNNIIERTAKYYFLYRGTSENSGKVNSLINVFKREIPDKWSNLVHFVPLAPDEFPYWAEHILYDPFGKLPRCIMVFSKDHKDLGNHHSNYSNIEFTWPMKEAFTNWFQTMWNKNLTEQDRQNWEIT